MKNTIYINKPIGLTPLEVVNKFKRKYPEYKNEVISYAGRLDPMAQGVLILLIGDENKNRDNYLGLDKEYESEFVIGVSTDTYDSLGLVKEVNNIKIDKKKLEEELSKFIGKRVQEFPPYSSKVVNGKPLYFWAREGRLDEIKIPEKEIEIYSVDVLDQKNITGEDLAKKIIEVVIGVKGDFRQEVIIENWKKFGKNYKDTKLLMIKVRITCSTGTYIRGVANELGENLGTHAFAYSIARTRVGEVSLDDCLSI